MYNTEHGLLQLSTDSLTE